MVADTDGEPTQARPISQIWIDAQLPPALAGWLRAEHHADAIHLKDLNLLHASDHAIFDAARAAAHAVVLITKDDDFRKLLDRHGPPPQVIWVRCGNVSNRDLRRILLDAWPRVVTLLAAGESLVEIRPRGVGADQET